MKNLVPSLRLALMLLAGSQACAALAQTADPEAENA
jgi:hypothetical protein